MTTLELSAVRVGTGDKDADEAYWRASELEGQPFDDATWSSMRALAAHAVGGGPEMELETSREWCSVKASSGSIMVDVLWHGEFANVYYGTGSGDEQRLQAVLQRLRESGLTIVQGEEIKVVPPGATVAEMVAAQAE